MGIILFLVALRTVLGQYASTEQVVSPATQSHHEISLNSVVHPLVFPHILPPYGLAVVVTLSTLFNRLELNLLPFLGLLLLVMVFNLAAMLWAQTLLRLIKPVTLRILSYIFAVMQVALGLDMMLTGVKLEILMLWGLK